MDGRAGSDMLMPSLHVENDSEAPPRRRTTSMLALLEVSQGS